jgi:hypothetical protein
MVDFYVQSLFKTVSQLREDGHKVYYSCASGPDVLDLRNQLAGGSRHGDEYQDSHPEMDYTLWVDSDQAWEPWQVYQLIGHDVDIVSGVTRTRDLDWNFFPDDEAMRKGKRAQELPEGLTEVPGVGFAFMLIRNGVMKQIPYPWFRRLPSVDGKRGYSSEDISFCRLAAEAGLKIHIDPQCRVGHYKGFLI